MPASKWGRRSRGGLRVQQMAQIDADERDYVSLAALRDGQWPARSPAPDAGDPAILEIIATAPRAENACDRHRRHCDPIGGSLRLQPVAGIFPDHDLDQLDPLGLVDRFRQQLLVPDVVVARFLLVHRTSRTRAHRERALSIKGCKFATDLRELYRFPHPSGSHTNSCSVKLFTGTVAGRFYLPGFSNRSDRHAPQLVDPQKPRPRRRRRRAGLHRLRRARRVLSRAGRQRSPWSGLAVQPAGLRLHDLQPGQAQPVRGCPRRQNPDVRTAADVIGSGRKRRWPVPELRMQKLSCAVVAAWAVSLVFVPTGVVLAQGAPSGGTAPAATSAAAPEAKVPENKASESTAPEKEKAAPKKKKPARMTRQQEIDRSVGG